MNFISRDVARDDPLENFFTLKIFSNCFRSSNLEFNHSRTVRMNKKYKDMRSQKRARNYENSNYKSPLQILNSK